MATAPKAPVTISAGGGSVKNKNPQSDDDSNSNRRTYALVCYYYPQYRLEDVEQMPARDVNLLIKTAHQQKAIEYINHVQIAAAPHSKKGESIKKLIDEYKKLIEI